MSHKLSTTATSNRCSERNTLWLMINCILGLPVFSRITSVFMICSYFQKTFYISSDLKTWNLLAFLILNLNLNLINYDTFHSQMSRASGLICKIRGCGSLKDYLCLTAFWANNENACTGGGCDNKRLRWKIYAIIDPPNRGVALEIQDLTRLSRLSPQNMRNQCKQLRWKL